MLRASLVILSLTLLFINSVNAFTYNDFDISKSIVPRTEIMRGGPPRDAIPALTDPKFVPIDKVDWLKKDSRILGVYLNGIAKAYPLGIMNWHEIVNDTFNKQHVLITYCPLCFSGMAFDPVINGKRHIFGVSGLLYNSDVLLYDQETDSLWSQIMSKAISGQYVNQVLQKLPVENTTMQEWKEKYPDTLVLSRDTGHARNYTLDPYIEYRNSKETMFPVKFRAHGYHPKELVLGITIDNQSKAYPLSELSRTDGYINDNINGKDLYISYNDNDHSGTILDKNCQLLPATTLFWFAWYAFHPDTEIFKAEKFDQPQTNTNC